MAESLITVCVPAFECERFFARTLESLRAQTFDALCIRVSLDKGSDGSEAMLRKLSDRGEIDLIVQPRNLGWAANIQALLDRVDTPFFAIHFHDDWLDPTYFAKLHAVLDTEADAVCAYSDLSRQKAGETVGVRSSPSLTGPVWTRLNKAFATRYPGIPLRGLVRSRVLADGFSMLQTRYDSLGADFAWTPLLALHGDMLRVPEPLYLKQVHDRGVSGGWRDWPAGRKAAAFGAFAAETLRRLPRKPQDKAVEARAACLAWIRSKAAAWAPEDMDALDEAAFLLALDAAIISELQGVEPDETMLGEAMTQPVIRGFVDTMMKRSRARRR